KDGGATADERSLGDRFEAVAAILRELDMDRLWREATERERRTLVDELVEAVFIFPDHLEVEVIGAPRLNVLLSEVGLTAGSQNVGVGGPTRTISTGSRARATNSRCKRDGLNCVQA